jgi:RNA polymerase sigma-70 factor (sigma-E family)
VAESDFGEYVEARTGALLRLAYLLCGDPHTAEDIVQDALVRAHRRWDRVTQAGSPDAYVRRIVVNQHRSWRRRQGSTEVAVEPSTVPPSAVADAQDMLATRDLTWRLLRELSEHQRAVLVLRYYEDLSDADIAALLDCAPGTVRSLAARAFAHLRRHPDLATYAAPSAPEPTPTTPVQEDSHEPPRRTGPRHP